MMLLGQSRGMLKRSDVMNWVGVKRNKLIANQNVRIFCTAALAVIYLE
jgi:hypothetical protein